MSLIVDTWRRIFGSNPDHRSLTRMTNLIENQQREMRRRERVEEQEREEERRRDAEFHASPSLAGEEFMTAVRNGPSRPHLGAEMETRDNIKSNPELLFKPLHVYRWTRKERGKVKKNLIYITDIIPTTLDKDMRTYTYDIRFRHISNSGLFQGRGGHTTFNPLLHKDTSFRLLTHTKIKSYTRIEMQSETLKTKKVTYEMHPRIKETIETNRPAKGIKLGRRI